MRAVVYKEPFRVAVENVPDPAVKHPNDAIIKITSSCICGSDLHMYEGRTAAEPGIVFGHENMGIIQEVGPAVKAGRFSCDVDLGIEALMDGESENLGHPRPGYAVFPASTSVCQRWRE